MTIFVYQLGHHRTTSKVITKKKMFVSLTLIRLNTTIPTIQTRCLTFDVTTGVAVSTDCSRIRQGFRLK